MPSSPVGNGSPNKICDSERAKNSAPAVTNLGWGCVGGGWLGVMPYGCPMTSDADGSADSDDGARDAVTGIDHDPVSEWLEANIDEAEGPFTFSVITGGHSNITYRVDGAGPRSLVLRRPPLGAVLATAHDMGREHKIISGVGRSDVVVPEALGLCEDESVNGAPFYVMNHVEGVVFHDSESVRTSMPDSATRQACSQDVVEVLAKLHLVNPDEVGLGDLGRKEAYLARQLKRWAGGWEKVKTRELPGMERAHELLVDRMPPQHCTGIVHGDYRLGNMLVDPSTGAVQAVLDWELCTLGDVLADVGYLLNNWVQPDESDLEGATANPTAAGGFTSREEVVERYAELTGFEVTSINYYRAFQAWRLAAIVEGVLARYLKGVMVDESANTDAIRLQVDTLCERALHFLE